MLNGDELKCECLIAYGLNGCVETSTKRLVVCSISWPHSKPHALYAVCGVAWKIRLKPVVIPGTKHQRSMYVTKRQRPKRIHKTHDGRDRSKHKRSIKNSVTLFTYNITTTTNV